MQISRKFCDYASAYSSFEDIPDSKKLRNYEQQFKNDNVWKIYISAQYNLKELNDSTLRALKRAGERWKNTCDSRCHHACASPRIINNWSTNLTEEMSKRSAKMNYLSYLNNFYRFLMWHIDYPHSYNPVQFAVEGYKETETIWKTPQGGQIND